jgi:hypothetical protein
MNFLNNAEIDIFKDFDFDFLNKVIQNENIEEKSPVKLNNCHKIARGRARKLQLKNMTKEQKKQEQDLSREKNKISAKNYRERKKKYIKDIENKLKLYKNNNKKQKEEIKKLNLKITNLKKYISEMFNK